MTRIGWLLAMMVFMGCSATVHGGERMAGKELALVSSGAVAGAGRVLNRSGYVGTYLHLPDQKTVRISVRASGIGSPKMNLILADGVEQFTVADAPADYSITRTLPPGTYFLRIDTGILSPAENRSLTIHAIDVENAHIVNEHTDANALASADTYIQHFRRKQRKVAIPGIAPDSQVRVRLKQHAFNFGVNAPGTINRYLIEHPDPGSDAARFQQFILQNFNTLVPSNAGKWAYNEPEPSKIDMAYVDAILRFARDNGMRCRMHTLMWDTRQEPKWVFDLLDKADAGDMQAKESLRRAISRRIEYYVRDRSVDYCELDVWNESVHHPRYGRIFGNDGIAAIFNEALQAHQIASSGRPLRLYLNEYNVLQWSSDPAVKNGPPDDFANWYRWHVESILQAGGAVGGVGVQYYSSASAKAMKNCPHSPARIFSAMQNLSGTHLPITLSEFAIQKEASPQQAVQMLTETMRLVYGTPQATTLMIWGFHAGSVTPNDIMTALVDEHWNLTPVGAAYQELMRSWSVDTTAITDPQGHLTFSGPAGTYEALHGDQAFEFAIND